jgi:hypothetical protein
MLQLWWLPVVAVVLLATVGVLRRFGRRSRGGHIAAPPRMARLAQAQRRFHVERERLEAKFVQLAVGHHGPESPRWADCTFDDDVAYVRSRATGELSAFVAITLATESLESLERYDEVGSLQAGTAVFRFDSDHWETDGRAILNLTPGEAIRYYRGDLEIVEEELARRRS